MSHINMRIKIIAIIQWVWHAICNGKKQRIRNYSRRYDKQVFTGYDKQVFTGHDKRAQLQQRGSRATAQ